MLPLDLYFEYRMLLPFFRSKFNLDLKIRNDVSVDSEGVEGASILFNDNSKACVLSPRPQPVSGKVLVPGRQRSFGGC